MQRSPILLVPIALAAAALPQPAAACAWHALDMFGDDGGYPEAHVSDAARQAAEAAAANSARLAFLARYGFPDVGPAPARPQPAPENPPRPAEAGSPGDSTPR